MSPFTITGARQDFSLQGAIAFSRHYCQAFTSGVVSEERPVLRKQILDHPTATSSAGEIDVAAVATVLVTSETADHPIDNIFDGRRGPGGSRWVAEKPGEQTLIMAFDVPQTIRKVTLEIEEPAVSRTQELALALSKDGGQTYREVVRQEFNFSPPGTDFEREQWTVSAEMVTHLRLTIKPDKGNHACKATLTSLTLQ
jgi:hypothetical protein